MCKKFDCINQRKESQEKIGSNDASDANDAGFMGVKLFVTCVICVILKFFKKLIKKCWQFWIMCYNQKRKEQMFWWLADRKVLVKRKIELRIRRAPSNASALSRDSKWPGIRYWEYLQIRRCFWYLMSGFFVFYIHFLKIIGS